MKKELNVKEFELLEEAKQLRVFGGNSLCSSISPSLIINIGKDCATFGDCSQICPPPLDSLCSEPYTKPTCKPVPLYLTTQCG